MSQWRRNGGRGLCMARSLRELFDSGDLRFSSELSDVAEGHREGLHAAVIAQMVADQSVDEVSCA